MAERTPIARHKRYVKQLERRLSFLENRVANYEGNSDSFDRSEISALKWAIPVLKDEIECEKEDLAEARQLSEVSG